MTKELSIINIKKEIMDALVSDMRIITSFANKEKKATDYIGTNIFNYINEETSIYEGLDTYIYFDVTKKAVNKYSTYIISIELKSHIDIMDKENKSVDCLDEISKYIEEIINELYPYYRFYKNASVKRIDHFARRNIQFNLYEEDYVQTNISEDEENPNQELCDFITEIEECINKCKNCSNNKSEIHSDI